MNAPARAISHKVGSNRLFQLLGQWSDGTGPLYQELATALAGLVDDGSFSAGDQLPPERQLAASLAVSRGTVVKAFDRLAELGYVTRVQGSGTTVTGHHLRAAVRPDQFVGDELFNEASGSINLLKAVPDMLPAIGQVINQLNWAKYPDEINDTEPLGWWILRERIAEHFTSRGLATTAHQIMVTNGVQQAQSLAAAAMVQPGDVVLGEDDSWPGLIDGVRLLGARFEPVQMDRDGIIIEDLETKIDRYRPALIGLNPQHQNPTGTRMPADRVEAIAHLARRYRVPVFEDRITADLGFDRRQLPAIDDYDTGGFGITAGSLNKVVWSGLRVGWLRADAQIINRFRLFKATTDMFTSALSQIIALEALDRYDELLDDRVAQLRAACELVTNMLRTELPDWSFTQPRGGLSVWVNLPNQVSGAAFAQHAARHGVLVASGRQFCPNDNDCSNLRIPFTVDQVELQQGMCRLVAAWHSFEPQATSCRVV